MEFWGVEVKHGVPLHVDPGEDMIVHISQIALGEYKNNGNEPIRVYLNAGDQKLIIGTLSHHKFPQLSTEIVLEKKFELSHSWKNGSVFFSGYKVDASEDDEKTENEPAVTGDEAVKVQVPNEAVKAKQGDDDNDDSDEDSSVDDDDDDDEISTSEDSAGEEEKKVSASVQEKVTAEVDSDEDDEDDSSDDDDDSDESSEDDDTPKKTEDLKKRVAEATSSKNPVSNKKAKFVTPQKSEESKKPHVHIATPHPSKQAGKTSGGSNGEASKQQQTPKPAGSFGCKSCNRTFTSEMGLQSHTKAKHSAAA